MLGATSYNFAISVEVCFLTAYGANPRPKKFSPERIVKVFIIYSTFVPAIIASILITNGCAVFSDTFQDCAIYDFENTVFWPARQIWALLGPIMFYVLFSIFTLVVVVYRGYREERVHLRSSSSATERLGVQTKMRRKMILFTVLFVLQWGPVLTLFVKFIFRQPTQGERQVRSTGPEAHSSFEEIG